MYAVSPSYASGTSEHKTPRIEDENIGRWVLENNETTIKMNLETGEAYIMLRKYDDDASGRYMGSREIKSYDWEKIN